MRKVQLLIKRLIDIILSCVSLIVLFPFFAIIAVLIKLDSQGPVFFLQERIGKNQERFKVFKFRTMIDNAINIGTGIKTGEGDPRITKTGKILRKTSIDELPQLLNVLIGNMSLIGPRPAIENHLIQYMDDDYTRFHMKPGITGLAQINGRSAIPLKARLKYDREYIKNYSLLMDLSIFFRSIFVVFRGSDLYYRKIN